METTNWKKKLRIRASAEPTGWAWLRQLRWSHSFGSTCGCASPCQRTQTSPYGRCAQPCRLSRHGSYSLKIWSRPAMKHTSENIPLQHASLDVKWSRHLNAPVMLSIMGTTPSCCGGECGLDNPRLSSWPLFPLGHSHGINAWLSVSNAAL